MIRVDEAGPAQLRAKPPRCRIINRLGRKQQQPRPLNRPLRTLMPPQPACSLDHEIGRGEISYHQVKVEIEALLDDLCRHQHAPLPRLWPSIRPKPTQDLRLDVLSLTHCEAGMEKARVEASRSQRFDRFDCIINRIAHPGHRSTSSRSISNGSNGGSSISKSLNDNPARKTRRDRAGLRRNAGA